MRAERAADASHAGEMAASEAALASLLGRDAGGLTDDDNEMLKQTLLQALADPTDRMSSAAPTDDQSVRLCTARETQNVMREDKLVGEGRKRAARTPP